MNIEESYESTVTLPAGWAGWSPFQRAEWVVEAGLSRDLFGAMEWLRARGEWPSDEALDLIADRGQRRAVAPAVSQPGQSRREVKAAHHGVNQRGAAPGKGKERDFWWKKD
jgi:hypothetical protein